MNPELLFAGVLLLILGFAITNGLMDGGGIVSTVIMTRTMDPFPALCLVAACEILGVFLLGNAVVKTMGVSLISLPAAADSGSKLGTLLAAMAGALLWNTTMWRLSLPSSSSHALIGGLIGATWERFGWGALTLPVIGRILVSLAAIPLAAALVGFSISRLLYWGGQYMTPTWGKLLRALHVASLAGIALVHGSNDGQKSMAIMLLALMSMGTAVDHTRLPAWMGIACGAALAVGVIFGSRRTIKTVGKGLYRVQDLQGLCAQSTTMAFVGASSLAGFPMSTSHVMSSSILGAGAAVRPRGIRWDLVGNIGLAWLITIPAAGALAAFFSYVVSKAV